MHVQSSRLHVPCIVGLIQSLYLGFLMDTILDLLGLSSAFQDLDMEEEGEKRSGKKEEEIEKKEEAITNLD